MEENLNQNQQPKMQEPNKQIPNVKLKKKKAKVAVITLSTIVVLFLGLQVYASTNGYGNVFFMIKNLITTGNPAGKQEIFSDKDITLSYKSIELADGLKIQANRLEIKDGKTRIFLTVKSQDGELLPLKYEVTTNDNNGKSTTTKTTITGQKPNNTDYFEYEDIIEVSYEVKQDDILIIKISDSKDKVLRTLEINLETREITVKGEKDFEKISQIELKKYLDMFSELSNGDLKSNSLLYIAQRFQNNYEEFMNKEDYDYAIEKMTDRGFKNAIIKEFYGEKAEFEYKEQKNTSLPKVEILKGITAWKFDKENDAYKPLTAGEDYHYGRCLKIEDVSYENDIYTIKYIFLLANNYDERDDKLEELPQYETTIKLKRDENNLYSKYQIIDIAEGTEIKDKVSTKIEEENDNIFKDASKLNYISDFKDSQNGKIAVIKLGENQFKTSQKDGYYIYTDMFNNSYYIKHITNIESKFKMTSSDNKNALFCCTLYYIDNNNEEKHFELAVILSSDFSNTTIMGNYLSYTGSTSFTRFAGIYNEGNDTNDTNTEHYSKDEIMNAANWVQVWPDIGMKFKIPKNFEQGQVNEKNNLLSVEFSGWIVTQNNEGEPVKIKCYNELNQKIKDEWDVLEYNIDRTVKSTDNKYWTDWYPLKNDEDINSPENGYIRRSYGRVREDQIQKIIFDIKADTGIDVEHYTFIKNVLESVTSTSR